MRRVLFMQLANITYGQKAAKDAEIEEERFLVGDTYEYKELKDGPVWHEQVMLLRLKGTSIPDIAALYKKKPQLIAKILNHPPVMQELVRLREMVRLGIEQRREDAKKIKSETADAAVAYTSAVVKGEAQPDKVRLDASKLHLAMDPDGRFEPYSKEDTGRAPVETHTLKDFIENARRQNETKNAMDVEVCNA